MKVQDMKSRSSVLLVLSMVCFAISAASLWLIPVNWIDENAKVILVSILVWLGFAGGMVLTLILGARRRAEGKKAYPFPGIICFFKNMAAVICDVLWIMCVVVLVVLHLIMLLFLVFFLLFLLEFVISLLVYNLSLMDFLEHLLVYQMILSHQFYL